VVSISLKKDAQSQDRRLCAVQAHSWKNWSSSFGYYNTLRESG